MMASLNKYSPTLDIAANMTSSSHALPPLLVEVLGYMQRPVVCPEDVKSRISKLRVPEEKTGSHISSMDWRSGSSPRMEETRASDGTYGSRYTTAGGYHGGGGGGSSSSGGRRRESGYRERGPPHHDGPPRTSEPAFRRSPADFAARMAAPRFGNRARKEATTEERMMDRIRDKMNKFSPMTYEPTKVWLSQLLDSGETEFLSEFLTLVFEKAAAEKPFCALYAKLVTELCTGFPHLKSELHRIFNDFMTIFEEARDVPDVESAEYAAFLELRERRKFRRGYSAFLGEIATLGILTPENVEHTSRVILSGMTTAKKQEGQQLLCEEYAECVTTLLKSSKTMVQPRAEELRAQIREAMTRTDSPSLTNKARFSLMDLLDILQ
jgi:hypothetical protein